jgi:DNA polymerase-4
MDAFYASVELLRYPELRGQPVVVGGGRDAKPTVDAATGKRSFRTLKDYAGRGVVTTSTYEARAFGVFSAMPMMRAKALCPQAVLLPVDFDEYRRFSRAFKAVITEIAPVMEDRGVDEVYIDFTQVPGGQRDGGRALARLIQRAIRDATGLSCSIGVAPNKLLAKMASEFDKPGGVTVLLPEDLEGRIWPLACRKINGIGPKTAAKLDAMGIHTIGQLAALEAHTLRDSFGELTGSWLHAAAWGRDDRPVEVDSEPVSMSRETTFERDLHPRTDRAELSAMLSRLCEKLATDLQTKTVVQGGQRVQRCYEGRTVGIKLRFDDFATVTRDITLPFPTNSADTILKWARDCLKRVPQLRPAPGGGAARKLRLLGVRVGKLSLAHDPAGEYSRRRQ